MIAPGTYIAKAQAIRFMKSKTDKLGIEVKFALRDVEQYLYWTGWCTESALQNTLKTLVDVLEYDGDETVVSVPENDPRAGMLTNQDCINRKKEVNLVVEIETYEGKDRARIKWVNNVGGGQFGGCAPEVVKNELGTLGFRARYLAIKQGAAPSVGIDPFEEGKLGF